jgi:hypothetical protein
MKMWIALLVSNAVWAGIAIADSPFAPGSVHPVVGRVMALAAHDPDGNATIIQTDKDGHVIVPMPSEAAITNALLKVIRLDKDGHVICAK